MRQSSATPAQQSRHSRVLAATLGAAAIAAATFDLYLGLVVILGIAVLVVLATKLSGVDADVDLIAGHLTADRMQQALLARWLSRARWARQVGGVAGLVAVAAAGFDRVDVLLAGSGGVAAGAMVAELHHVRRRRGPRTARLDVRTVRGYLHDRDFHRMVFTALVAATLVAVGVLADDYRAAAPWAVSALVVLGLARLVQQRVASRPRGAMPEHLTRADDFARELAIGRGLAQPCTVFALTLLAAGLHRLSLDPQHWLANLVGSLLWLHALRVWLQNRRLGLDWLREPQVQPVLA